MSTHDLPPEAIRPNVPRGTPISKAADADRLKFWCSAHGVLHQYDGDVGAYVPQGIDEENPDPLHPPHGVRNPGDLITHAPACGDALGFDPAKYPNAGPGAVARAYGEVLRERRRGGP